MIRVNCVIQADSSADAARAELERGLVDIHRARYPDAEIEVTFQAVAEGYMFTEGQQSTSSIVAIPLGRATTLPEREEFLRAVCDLWVDVTGCTDHEVVVAITSGAPAAESADSDTSTSSDTSTLQEA